MLYYSLVRLSTMVFVLSASAQSFAATPTDQQYNEPKRFSSDTRQSDHD